MKTIFYSWQSDRPSEINEKFIEESIEDAAKKINEDMEIDISPRINEHLLKLDRDIKDTPGSPPIVENIFKKIDKCSIFVADLTFVAKTDLNPKTNHHKLVPNPNVLVEYGYACKSRGYGKIISIMNTVFGKPTPENVPFNIRHLPFPVQYELNLHATVEIINSVKRSLSNQLVPKFRLILDNESKNAGKLITELLPSKFYISKNKVIILLKLKVINAYTLPVSVTSDKLKLKYNEEWLEAIRTTISENQIQTDNKGTVQFASRNQS